MVRILLLVAALLAGSAFGAPEAFADQADCWRGIEAYKKRTDELSQLTENHRNTKTEEARCAMLAKTREATLQKIDMSNACAPYVSTAQSDIAKAKQDLKLLDSPQLKCAAPGVKAQSEEDRCSIDLSASRAGSDESVKASRAYRASGSDADFCMMVTASERAVAAATKAVKSCRRLHPEEMAKEQAETVEFAKLIATMRRDYAKRCKSGSGART
ncbi:hypothetical protein [Microvirga flavescens]|uniref:hypothetical protein n=1 Tax=Microvirga flavescens TaxID=2249811 RepID=UPI000DD873CD|nr:hypothetical protein [Microvirga flavescens]